MGGKVVSLEGIPDTLGVAVTVPSDNAEQPAKQAKLGLLGLLGVWVWNDYPGPAVLSGR